MQVRFNNIEDPTIPVECTIEGEGYKLYNGRIYDLPQVAIDHLNQCAYPVYEMIPNPDNPKEMITRKVGERPRFLCTPVQEKDYTPATGDKDGGDEVDESKYPINKHKKTKEGKGK